MMPLSATAMSNATKNGPLGYRSCGTSVAQIPLCRCRVWRYNAAKQTGFAEQPMELTPAQLAQYERDGFLIFPDLFTSAEIAVLRQEVARLAKLDTEEVFREHTGGVKSIIPCPRGRWLLPLTAISRAGAHAPRAAAGETGPRHRRDLRLPHQSQCQAGH